MSFATLYKESYGECIADNDYQESKADAINELSFGRKMELVKAAGLLDMGDKKLMIALMADVRNSLKSDLFFIQSMVDMIMPNQNCFEKYLAELIYQNDLL